MSGIAIRLKAAAHETRCSECRVTWRSWLARVLGVGGMTPGIPRGCTCAKPLAVGATPRACPIHGWMGDRNPDVLGSDA